MNTSSKSGDASTDKEYRRFVWSRIIGALVIVVALIWGFGYVADRMLPDVEPHSADRAHAPSSADEPGGHGATDQPAHADNQPLTGVSHEAPLSHGGDIASSTSHGNGHDAEAIPKGPRGAYFIDKLIEPIEYELTERFWGWRPNDYLNFTDNVNEMQLGVLEVTRRATVHLTESISRRGSAEALDQNLENAMNSFMIQAENYLFPAPETQYPKAIEDLRTYQAKLADGKAGFYIRADNLIPLLKSCEELLGSCDDRLVKQNEDDGDPVSTFQADNHFYYSKGVAKAMESVLRGVEHEFKRTIEVRGGVDIIDHAIHACHIAAELEPWLWVTEGDLNGILANHRANMAAHISHARFYVSLLIEALST